MENSAPLTDYDLIAGNMPARGGGKSIFTDSAGQASDNLGPNTLRAFEQAAIKYQVPADILMGVAEKDSGFDAFSQSQGLGPKTRGIISLNDADVAKSGINPYETDQAVGYAAQKFKSFLDQGLSVPDAVKAMKFGPNRDAWGPEAENYANDVLGRAQKLSQTYFPAPEAAPEAPKERPGYMAQFGADVSRGFSNLKNIGIGAAGLVADVAGFDDYATSLLNSYVENEKQLAKENPAVIGSYEKIGGLDDAARYAIEAVGENVAMFLPSLATGGIGAAVAKRAAQRGVTALIEDQVAKGVARDVAAKNAAEFVSRRLATGAAGGAYASSAPMEAGSIYGDIYEKTGERRPGLAAGAGAVAGALDVVEPVMAITKVAGSRVADGLTKSLVRRLGAEGAKQFLAEAGTEGAQTIIENMASLSAQGKDLTSPEVMDGVVDSMLKGGIGGGVMGVASQGVEELSGRKPPEAGPQRREPTFDGSVEAMKDVAAEAPGRQTASDLEGLKDTPERAPQGDGPMARAMKVGAPDLSQAMDVVGKRVVLTDEVGTEVGTVTSQDADGVLFQQDDGFERYIPHADIAAGRVGISQGVSPMGEVRARGPMVDTPPAPAADYGFTQQNLDDEAAYYEERAREQAETAMGGAEAAAETPQPVAPPVRKTLDQMSEPELRDRLKALAEQARAAGGWNGAFMKMRRDIEQQITARQRAAATSQPATMPDAPGGATAAAPQPNDPANVARFIIEKKRVKGWKAAAEARGLESARIEAIGAEIKKQLAERAAAKAAAPKKPNSVTSKPNSVTKTTTPPAAPKVAIPPSPEPPVDEKPATPAPRADDDKIKWLMNNVWGARPAAAAAVENNGLADTHEVYEKGNNRYGIREKAAPQGEISPPAPQVVEIPAAPAPKTEGEVSPKAQDSEQFKNYADYINAGNTLATGDREQIAMDERLNDGEAERLLAMADKAASAQESAPKSETPAALVKESLTTEPSGNPGELETAASAAGSEPAAPAPAAKPKRDAKRREEKKGKAEPAQAEAPTPADPVAPSSLVEKFRDKFLNSTEPPFKTIVEARKFAKENGLVADEGKAWTKVVDETIEHGLVLAARQLAETHRADPKEAFRQIVALYERQPNLGSRTSESIAEQAYSTPAPLAYIASQIAGITGSTTVLEPTAGNGMLLMEADPAKATANELNDMRRAALDAQGFKTSGEDAAESAFDAGPKVDVVIANPPFGAVKEAGESKVFRVDSFQTTQIDHAISLNALKAMKPDGRAVLIIGGIKAESNAERAKGYGGKAKRTFFYKLLNEYNVTDIFTVSGDLYAKQGAGWPVDVIVIDGKGASSRAPLTKEPPPLLNSWEQVGEKLNEQRSQNGQKARGNIEAGGEPGGVSVAEKPESAIRNDSGGEGAVRGESVSGKPKKGRSERVGGSSDRGESGPVRAEQPMDAGAPAPAARRRNNERVDYVPDTERGRPVKANEAGQTPYRPASTKGVSLGTLVPANLRSATAASLDRVQRQYGKIDNFVANELGYEPDELGRYFSAEQVDAIGLGISNIDKGDGFIIGDQTGIGKGRVVAAMISYAKRKGMTPVFVTEKPDLYGDMWRDLHDIGWNEKLGREISIFMTNSGARVPLDEEAVEWSAEAEQARLNGDPIPERRGQFTPPQSGDKADARMAAILRGEESPDVVFTTYDQMNSVKGMETSRRNFLRQIAPKSFLIMDEAHNAGGSGGGEDARFKEKGAPPRSKVFREVVGTAQAVMYSSATYAKSPQVMDLFSRTDMAKAVEKPAMLPELISKGGVPLQQVVSSMLSDSGQYLRRERSFEGVTYDPETVPVNESAYASFTNGLRAIFEFDRAFSDDRKEIAEQMAAEIGGGTGKDGAVGDAGASATEFSSVMHNIIGQMILAIKAEKAGQRAVEAIKAGEKPVIALSKTNESFIKDFVGDQGLKAGDSINLSFGDILKRYLERTRRITIKTGANEKRHVMIPLSEMGSHAESYKSVMAQLREMELTGLPVSPIDAIRHEIEKSGYSVREITGRSLMVDYSGSEPVLKDRPRSEQGAAGKRVSVKAFNDGKVDALILNKSGSTGISMHSSSKFKDQRKRRMILVEADPNIDTHMQMLGRVHRTGQVLTPAYTQLAADIPAEVRPTANLMRKMASLNANTTGAKKSKFSSESVDFMNKYGDRVIAEILRDDPEINAALGEPINPEGGEESLNGAIAKVTGRLTLLDPTRQQELLDRITSNYSALIERLDAEGINDLEAKSVDLQARVVETTTVKTPAGPSPFQSAVNMDKVSIKSQGRAMEPSEVLRYAAESLGAKVDANSDFATNLKNLAKLGGEKHNDLIEKTRVRATERLKQETAVAKNEEAKEKVKKKLNDNFKRWRDIAQMAHPGAIVNVQFRGQDMPAIVIGFDQKGDAKNPVAMSSWTLSLALPDSARSLGVPLSQVFTPDNPSPDGSSGVSIAPNGSGRFATQPQDIEQLFEAARKEGRETRYMFSGNILAAYDQTRGQGQIINHTMEDGSTRPAILMNRTFDPGVFMSNRAIRFKTGEQVLKFLNTISRGEVTSTDGVVTIRTTNAGNVEFDLPSAKATGGKYFADSVVRKVYDAWEKRGQRMRALVTNEKGRQIIDAMMSVDAVFETKENQKEAEEIIGVQAPKTEEPKASIGQSAGMTADALRNTLTSGKDGGFVKALIDAGRVVLHDTAKTAPGFSTQRGPVQAAVTPDGTMHFVAGNLDASTARGVLLHEAFHAGGETLLGSAGFRALLRRVQTAADSARPGSWVAEAKARAEAAGTPAAHMAEEIAAYAIEDFENAPAGIKEIADRIVGAVKAFVLRKFGKQFGSVTPGQLRALAASALRAGAPVGETQERDGVRFSIARTAGAAVKNAFNRSPDDKRSAVARAANLMSDIVTAAINGTGSDAGKIGVLALTPVRPLFTELSAGMPAARHYIDTKQAMDAFRNEMNTTDGELMKSWIDWAKKNRDANDALVKVMFDATLDQYEPDPAMAHTNDHANPALQNAYDALPEEAKKLYADVRNAYKARSDAMEKQIFDNVKNTLKKIIRDAERKHAAELQRIEDEGLEGEAKAKAIEKADKSLLMAKTREDQNRRARIKKMRDYFERNRLKGPYFPLARFGNYYVTLRDENGKVLSFEKYETPTAQREAADAYRKAYGEAAVEVGAAGLKTSDQRNLDPTFVTAVDSILDQANVPIAVRDQIYQTYLETMPDLSMRKHQIHRKNRPGFNEDAVRSYAHVMFHSAHQLARLKYGLELQDHLAETETQIKGSGDPVRNQAVYNEMVRAHDFAMNPEGSAFSYGITSLTYLWTMAGNISTAMVNATQSVNVGIPNLAFDKDTSKRGPDGKMSHVGIKAAAKALANASIDFMRGKGSVLNSSELTDDERAAVSAVYDTGLIDATQAHDLAGVAEKGFQYTLNPVRNAWSTALRWASEPMHQTERFNREITFLAAYRLARRSGMAHEPAIKKASDQTWATHFDNQASSKPRFARGEFGRMAFALRSYQANLLYRLFRDMHQSTNGMSPAEREVARKRFTAMMGITAAVAGIRGAPFYGALMMLAGAVFGALGKDDDDPEEALRKLVAETAGDSVAGRAISGMLLDGVPGYLTGTSLTNRVGQGDLWFRGNDRDMTPEQQWSDFITSNVTPLGVAHTVWQGLADIEAGNTERGVEKMLPASVKNIAKAWRYGNEGVQDKNGNPIVQNVPIQDVLKQVIGFTPAEIADRMARNTFQNNMQDRIEKDRTATRKAYARAVVKGDQEAAKEAMTAIDDYNKRRPQFPITGRSIMDSIKAMQRRGARMEFGVDLDPKLRETIKARTAPSIYAR